MTLRLNGSTSGYTEIDAPAVAGSNTLVLPTGNGSDGNILGTDGAGNLSWVGGRMVLETAQATTSGTSIDFTGIPSWVKKITVMFNGVSTNGSGVIIVQIGSGSFVTSGYIGSSGQVVDAGTSVTSIVARGVGFGVDNALNAAAVRLGTMVITSFGSNTWLSSAMVARSDIGAAIGLGAGLMTLSGPLDRVRITSNNGTDAFDAGSVNLLLEG
jgi:hypothetical protein